MAGCLLKLLSGLQAGAEFSLRPGSYALGSGDAADLVLADAAVRELHAVITGDDTGQWSIEPVDGAAVSVDGAGIAGKTPLQPYKVVGLGGVHFALGPEGSWEELPRIPAAKPAAAPPNSEGESGAAEAVSPPAAAAENAVDSASPDSAAEKVPRRRLPRSLTVPALVAALAAAGWFGWTHFFRPTPEELALRQAAARLSARGVAVLSPAPAQNVPGMIGLKLLADGRLAVSGIVQNQQKHQDILDSIGAGPYRLVDQLDTAQRQAALAEENLHKTYPGLGLDAGPAGGLSLRLAGIVADPQAAATAYRTVRDSLDSGLILRNGLTLWPDVQRDAERSADRLGLTGAMVEYRDGKVRFSAERWPNAREKRLFLETLRDNYGDRVAEQFETALASPPPPIIKPDGQPDSKGAASPFPPVLPDLDARRLALAPLPQISPADASRPGGATAAPSPAPAALPPRPDPKPEAPSPPPPPAKAVWRINVVDAGGFVDQAGNYHRVGEVLPGGLQILKTWDAGVVMQRGGETIFAGLGTSVEESSGSLSPRPGSTPGRKK